MGGVVASVTLTRVTAARSWLWVPSCTAVGLLSLLAFAQLLPEAPSQRSAKGPVRLVSAAPSPREATLGDACQDSLSMYLPQPFRPGLSQDPGQH